MISHHSVTMKARGFSIILSRAFGGEAVSWYSNAALWWPILILTSVWKGAGYGSIVYFCALTGFDQSLYEAAEIDGANRFKKYSRNPAGHFPYDSDTADHAYRQYDDPGLG